ncbi:MAG: alpha/beta hydrolase [Betaproteobacteria bacterium]|nr:alpha/beta hydrolase [Betaproteobacteria bacterium]
MNANTERFYVAGPAGQLECALDLPEAPPVGIALLAHPHPLYGGTMDNKVVQIMARAFIGLNYASVRVNFRGVGHSAGAHAEGLGEAEDMAVVLEYVKKRYPDLPVALGGYSFGTYVQSLLQQRLASEGNPPERMVLVSVTAGKWAVDTVPKETILIHGETDEIIPLSDLFQWARPQDLSVVVVTGGDHLFNRKLHHIRRIIGEMWHR